MSASPICILLVDDDALNLRWLESILAERGYDNVLCAHAGADAWEILQLRAGSIDLVLLGDISLLRRMKQHPQLCRLPVIMQGSAVQSEHKREALTAGAYYHVSKPYGEQELLTIVEAAQRDIAFAARMRHDIKRFQHSVHLLKASDFVARTLEDAMYLGSFIANFFPKPEQVVVGLTELLINGIEHGNLGISYLEKGQLLHEGRWEEEINLRLNQPYYQTRQIEVHLHRRTHEISVEICDQGAGFEWQRYLEIDPQRASHPHGRGIAIANLLSFDALEFNKLGNQVRCISHLHAQQSAPRAFA